jgi:diphthamide synthase (EF-2-diphthine--ammonia ligase)
VNSDFDRVAMHAVRRTLLESQADRLGLPVHFVEIPAQCPNDVYEAHMQAAVAAARELGIQRMVFGDLFLEDIRQYRERNLAEFDITPVFPLWGISTAKLARDMIDSGLRAIVTCVDPKVLPTEFCGRDFDESFLADLPAEVDPCGERGEFHTFVWDCASFRQPIEVEAGEVVVRDGFVFCDIVAADQHRSTAGVGV